MGGPPNHEAWAEPIIEQGPRPAYRMEQVVPGEDQDGPIPSSMRSSGKRPAITVRPAAGSWTSSRRISGVSTPTPIWGCSPSPITRRWPSATTRRESGSASSPSGMTSSGLLPWGHVENRPFLRCLHGYGLCLRRLGRFDEAEEVFTRLLWLNPADNQGVRFELCEVKERGASHA